MLIKKRLLVCIKLMFLFDAINVGFYGFMEKAIMIKE